MSQHQQLAVRGAAGAGRSARDAARCSLIRTAQRALNQAVARRFLRTRGALARAEVAEGVALGDFLAEVAHHARRDLWTAAAVEWAETNVGAVLHALEEELARFLETVFIHYIGEGGLGGGGTFTT